MYEKVKEFCKSQGIPVVEFERRCGFSHGYVLKLKKICPSAAAVKKMAKVMNVPIAELMELIGEG